MARDRHDSTRLHERRLRVAHKDSARGGGVMAGALLVVLTLLGWSVVPLFLRHFAELIDPWTSNGWRYGLSALLWLPLVVVVASRKKLPRGIWALALVPSIFNAVLKVDMSDVIRIIVSNGMILYALTRKTKVAK